MPEPDSDRQAIESVDHLFRKQAGQMVATLTRILGVEHLELVEDSVQDALLHALKRWPYHGVPDNPRGWIVQVAKNRALDRLRRRGTWARKSREWAARLEDLDRVGMPSTNARATYARELADDQLQLVFMCCHPQLGRDAQVALTLNLVGGFSAQECASAFLTRRDTMAQRLVRAKRKLRTADVHFELPTAEELPERLDAVLEVLYLMFNEGHGAHQGADLVRRDLCHEAIRLALLLADHPVTGTPVTDALVALLLFQGSRLDTRVDEAGDLLLMAHQDRSLWDRGLQRQGALFLARAGRGDELSRYHLEAEIASCHALAHHFDATDWLRILECYDELYARHPSPVVELNRLVALAQVNGPEPALAACTRLLESRLADYYPAHVLRGELLADSGQPAEARSALEQARALTASQPMRRHLDRRLASLI